MAFLLIGAGALLAGLGFLRWFARADAATLTRSFQFAGQWLLAALALFTALRGEFAPAVAILLAAAAWYLAQVGRAARQGRLNGQARQNGQGRTREAPRAAPGNMTREQAFDILGLSPDAGEADIREAHRRLIQKIHPDHGGSSFLAAQINAAKDFLLK